MHFDPAIFLVPNIGYQIDAIDAHGLVISTSGPKEPNVTDGYGSFFNCAITCVGNSYAYSLKSEYPITGYNGAGEPILGPQYLRVGGAALLEDFENAIFIPFWQAIDQNTWDQMELLQTHPYLTGAYDKTPIIEGELWWDAQDNPVDNGMLVSKGLDQFAWFYGRQTIETATYPQNFCNLQTVQASDFYFAMNFYNNYNVGPGTNPFIYFTPASNLGCIPSLGYAFQGQIVEEEDDTVDLTLDDWILQDFYAELDDFINSGGGIHKPGGVYVTDWKQLNDEFRELEDIDGTHGVRVVQVRLKSILDDNVNLVYTFDEENGMALQEVVGELEKGLYQMTIYTNKRSIIIPSVLEIANDLPEPQDKDFFELTIAPNPIVNNELSYVVVGSKTTNVTAIVFNLNGDVIQSQTIPFSASSTRYLGTVDLTNVATPQNQIRVSMIFQDGSILQKTGLKL